MSSPTWTYTAAALTSAGTVTRPGKCYGLTISNTSASVNASFTINGGDTITLYPGQTTNINPKGKLFDATVTWVSGSLFVMIETLG